MLYKNEFIPQLSRFYATDSSVVLKTTQKKKKVFVFHIAGGDVDRVNVYYNNLVNLEPYNRYSIIIRLSYISMSHNITVTEWKTLGEQIYFTFDNLNDLHSKLLGIKDAILDRLRYTLEFYSIKHSDVLGLQFLVYSVYYNEVVKKTAKINLQSLGIHKDLVSINKIANNSNMLPLSINENEYGVLLNKTIKDGFVASIMLIDGVFLDFANLISLHTKAPVHIPEFVNFYQSNLYNKSIIILVHKVDAIRKHISIYNVSGFKISDMTDDIYNNGLDNRFKRTLGNVILHVDRYTVTNKEVKIDLKPIQPKKITGSQSYMSFSDYKYGTLDLETYVNKFNIPKVYALGFYVKNHPQTYYLNNKLTSEELIMNCLDDMLAQKYNQYTFYVHNLGSFDATFLLKVIITAKENKPDIYNYDLIWRDNKIICLKLSKKILYTANGKTIKRTYSIKIVDSLNILQNSLHKLCLIYKPTVVKTVYPYSFVNINTISYIGDKPDISYYNNLSNEEYAKIPLNEWSTQTETIKYLENDLESLFSILEIFIKDIWLHHSVHVTNNYTISGLSLDIYLNNFYSNNIPLINKKSLHNDIRLSYFGGVTEVYKPYGENLYYYDVNSLYPYAALNPMPGLKCVYVENINLNIEQYKHDMFGFYYCKIKTNNMYIGLLPVRKSNGGIYMPEGEFSGWYFSAELIYAASQGYNIHVNSGYKFDQSVNVFDSYIKHFYKIKAEGTEDITISTAKSFLNNLLGRLGMDINKPITRLLTYDEYQEILQTRKIKGDIKHIGDKILVKYEKNISYEVCKNHDVDYHEACNKLFNMKSSSSVNLLNNVSVGVISAITSYSRIFMSKVKLDILSNKGSIYYTDTDSIITNQPLSDQFVGGDIGQFKLVDKVKQGYFISNKTYCLVLSDGSVITKVKGDNSKKHGDKVLGVEDFKELYRGIDIKTTRFESELNYTDGYTRIKIARPITLSATSYVKRSKLYEDNVWTDTKPLNINMSSVSNVNTISNLDPTMDI